MSARVSRDDAGFTLVEVMVAGTLSVLMALPAYSLLSATYRFADKVQSRFRQSEEARQVLSLLGDGSVLFGTQNNARGFPMVEGLRSRVAAPAAKTLRLTTGFVMSDSNGLSIAGDTVPPLQISCSAAAVPIPDCQGTETQTVQGWLGSDPVLVAASPQTVGVSVSIIDPYRAQRMGKAPASVAEGYRSIFSLNVEANP